MLPELRRDVTAGILGWRVRRDVHQLLGCTKMLYTGSPCAGEHPESTVIQNPTRAGCAWNVPTMVHVAVSTNEEAVLMTGFVGCTLVTPQAK